MGSLIVRVYHADELWRREIRAFVLAKPAGTGVGDLRFFPSVKHRDWHPARRGSFADRTGLLISLQARVR